MDNVTVLITSAGVSSAINIIKSLRLQKEVVVSLIAVDVDHLAAGLYLADQHYISPPAKQKRQYIEFLLKICKKHNVKALFPCYSGELLLISESKAVFDDNNIDILISPPETIRECNDKQKANRIIRDLGLPVPETIDNPSEHNLPLFSKPLTSSSSKGTFFIDDKKLLHYLLSRKEPRIFQEYIEGVEYTVDVFCDKQSKLLFSGPRIRLATKAGQSVKSISIKNSTLDEYATKICKKFGIVGACNIQFIEKNGKYYFIEINPRFAAGGLMLTTHAGANIPLAALKLMMDLPLKSDELKHKEHVAMTRFWEEIIIEDYDEH